MVATVAAAAVSTTAILTVTCEIFHGRVLGRIRSHFATAARCVRTWKVSEAQVVVSLRTTIEVTGFVKGTETEWFDQEIS